MGTPGPQKINRYGVEFKLKAVQLSHQPGVLIKDVAASWAGAWERGAMRP